MRLPSPIVSSNSLKKIASSYIYVRQERSSSETNDRAPRTFTRFYAKKKRIKEKKKKKEGKAVRSNWRLFFVALLLKIWKKNSFLYVALGAVPGEYITYPLVPGK